MRKHAGDMRQLAISISNTELQILEFARVSVGAGKLTRKPPSKAHHTPSYAYALWNRQALALLAQVEPYMQSYKRDRARLALRDYVRLTPRNGKYTDTMLAERGVFESTLLGLLAAGPKRSPFSLTAEGAHWWRRRDSRFRLFRDGLDYAFILQSLGQLLERSVLFEDRNRSSNPSAGSRQMTSAGL